MIYSDPFYGFSGGSQYLSPSGSVGYTGADGQTGFVLGQYFGTDEFDQGYGGPFNLNSYQNVSDTIILYWSFYPYGPIINDMTWEIQTDLVDTFDSVNLRLFNSHIGSTATAEFIDGVINKGISVPIYPRLESVNLPIYWRIRGTYGDAVSSWKTAIFMLPASIRQDARNTQLALLPDVLYAKSSDSNMYNLHDSFSKEFDVYNQDATLVSNDSYIDTVRDEYIIENFGQLVDIAWRYEMKAIDYREIVKSFMQNIRSSPTTYSVSEIISTIYGYYPEFKPISKVFSMYLGSNSITDPNYTVPFYTGNLAEGTPDVVIWDARHVAYGTIVEVLNKFDSEGNNIIPKQYVLDIIRTMSPSHVPVFIDYK